MHLQHPSHAVRIGWMLCVLLLLGLGAAAVPASGKPAAGPLLRLHRGTLDARNPITPAALGPLGAVVPNTAIIQFAGPITAQQRTALAATGVTLIEYLPDYAYLVRGASAQLDAAAALPNVYARTPFLAADKAAPALFTALTAGVEQTLAVRFHAWPGQAAALAAALTQAGIDPTQALTTDQLQAALLLPSVRWAEPMFAPQLFNSEARTIMRVPTAWEDHGLYGAGQVVAIADTGLDTGDLSNPDFAGRLVAAHTLAPEGTLADEIGHGTHVAGSLLGAGVLSGADPTQRRYEGSLAGVAPEAGLVLQAFEADANGAVQGLGDDPYPIFAQAYADGARIHSNSWGGPTGIPFLDPEGYFGGYTTPAQRADAFIWDHPDMAIFFAAGNSGNDGDFFILGCLPNGDGRIDDDSLNAPGTAKNVITIGASENVRVEGNLNTLTWSDFNATCFGREPLASDLLSNNPNGMAAFSSRGPVDDGRMKPDLVAPGTSIVSNRSSHSDALPLWGPYSANSNYTISGGTSMATPLAAGAGALVREWLQREGLAAPSAAALKAVLISTAADMAPGQYGTGPLQEIPYDRPNYVAGWGRVDLGFLSAPEPYTLWVDDRRAGLTTGERVTYTHTAERALVVADSAQPLRITLTWTDPPASLTAARQLVNDLDLVVTGPDGQVLWGNGVNGGDRVDNVEGVIISAPQPGAYTVEVRAHNVPIDLQPYALVVAGGLDGDAVVAPPVEQPDPTPTTPGVPTATPTTPGVPTATPRPDPAPQFRIFAPLIRRN